MLKSITKNQVIRIALVVLTAAGIGMSVATYADSKEIKNELIEADELLNQEYKKLRGSRTTKARKILLQSQKQWLAERDTLCKLQGLPDTRNEWLAAVIKDKEKARCVTNKTNDRIARFRANQMTPPSVVFTHQAQDKYPPYPEVWGYIGTSWPSKALPGAASNVRPAISSNGDFVLRFREWLHPNQKIRSEEIRKMPCDDKSNAAEVFFFSARALELNCTQDGKWENRKPAVPRIDKYGEEAVLGDGSLVSFGQLKGFNEFVGFNYYLSITDANKKKIKNKTILFRRIAPLVNDLSRTFGGHTGIARLDFGVSAIRLVVLSDNTFVVYQNKGGYLLRFDRNLNTHYPINRDRIWVIDTDVIRKIVDTGKAIKHKNKGAYLQYVNDQVVSYLREHHDYKW